MYAFNPDVKGRCRWISEGSLVYNSEFQDSHSEIVRLTLSKKKSTTKTSLIEEHLT